MNHHPPQSARDAKGRDAKFFTFDRMERLLTYCVPLAVDPRSPESRVNDVMAQNNDKDGGRDEEIRPATSSMESKQTEEESVSHHPAAAADNNYYDPRLQSRSIESIPNIVTEGLLEHTNRLREKMMDRTRSSSGAVTTPARMLERRMELQGRGGGGGLDDNMEEMDTPHHHHEEPSSVLVPGGLWSLPSDERYGTNSLSQSFMDSRSMHSSRSGEERRAKNPYYCGNDLDDVLLMRSTSDGGSDEVSGGLENGSSESVEENHGVEKNHLFERTENLVLDTAGLDGVNMDDVMNTAAMNAVNGLLSPRSLASEDKYMLDDDAEDRTDEREDDPYADAHELSHYRRDVNAMSSMYQGEAGEARDDNEAVNRHFDTLISDFELNIRQEDSGKGASSRFNRHRQFQEKKKLVQRSREHKKAKSPRVEDDTISKTSHVSDHSTALFLHSTTMGRKLNRSTPTSPGAATGSIASSKESVLDRARQAVTSVHQVMGSRNDAKETNKQEKRTDKVVNSDVPTRSKLVESAQKKKSVDTLIRQVKAEGALEVENDIANQESSPMSSYKKRLMEQRSRRIKREFASNGEEEGDVPQGVPSLPIKESRKTNPAPDNMLTQEPSQEEANLDTCASGTSFDSSVNWDALAYSMSGSMSMNGVQAPQHNVEPTNIKPPEPIAAAPSPKNQHLVMGRIEQIKKQHDQKMAQLRMVNPDTVYQPDGNRDAPDDECHGNVTIRSPSQEENRPLSPNSVDSNDYLSTKSTRTSMSPTVQKCIEAMKHQIENEMVNNERHHEFRPDARKSNCTNSPGSSRQHSNRFNFERSYRPSPKKPSTEDLMMNNLMLEEEMEHIRALSPTNLPSPKSPISSPRSRKHFSQQGVSSPLSPKSPRSNLYGDYKGVRSPFSPNVGSPRKNQDRDHTPSYLRNHGGKCVLKVEIPTSPISTPRRTARLNASPKKSKSVLSPHSPNDNRVRTRVSDLMEEVKGFLAENDRARERIATDIAAMQAMHNY